MIATTAAIMAVAPANATIFYANYTPSDTPETRNEYFLPMDQRVPDAGQSFDTPAYLGAYCNSFCSGFNFYSVATEFTSSTSFSASHLIVPVRLGGNFGNMRIGFRVDRFDAGTQSWVGLVSTQIESGLLPVGQTREVELPFGIPGAGYVDYVYQQAQITAGDRYRIHAMYGAGAAGDFQWFLSDAAAGPGQSTEYHGGSRGSQANSRILAFQPAFALTDGGALVMADVPEPAGWALIALGFGLTGFVLRRSRAVAIA